MPFFPRNRTARRRNPERRVVPRDAILRAQTRWNDAMARGGLRGAVVATGARIKRTTEPPKLFGIIAMLEDLSETDPRAASLYRDLILAAEQKLRSL
jgi:hypothetical protein